MSTVAPATLERPRAFAVRFRDLDFWSVGSFVRVEWRWPKECIRPLSAALFRRVEEVDRGRHALEDLQLVTLHFDGTLEPRDRDSRKGFKGRLFFALTGDVVYSKIDVRNGAIGIVPPQMPRVVVSSEYPVYKVAPDIALSSYIKLLFRTRYFRRAINSMISGASGRKRVQPEQIEAIKVPLPPLPIQRAILDRWETAQMEIAAIEERVGRLEERVLARFYRDLGTTPRDYGERPKAVAVLWKDIDRWSVSSIGDMILGLDRPPLSLYPYFCLGDLATVSYGIQKSPANRPSQHARPYLRVANVRKGYLDLSEIKEINVGDDEMDAYRLEPGDILFVEGNGSRAELGRVGMWNGEIPDCVHQNHLIKVRVDASRLLPQYAMAWFNTEVGRNHFFRSAKTSSGLGTINSTEVRSGPIPLPPLEVQREIVRRVDETGAEIAQQREKARGLAAAVEQEVEEMILGTRSVPRADGPRQGDV